MSNVSIGPTGVVHLEARKFETAAEWMALGTSYSRSWRAIVTHSATEFGDLLRRMRESRRVSQSKLAERSDFDHSYISRLECGSRMPTRDAVDRLADALRVAQPERDELLAAAGLLPTNIIMINQASECGDLHRYLEDPSIPSPSDTGCARSCDELLAACRASPRPARSCATNDA
jgi:Predicted transcriptional regulator with C-terminal CBS domains